MGVLEGLGLGGAADAPGVAAEGNALLVLEDVAEVSFSFEEVHAADGAADLEGVLVVDAEVFAAGAGCLGRDEGLT